MFRVVRYDVTEPEGPPSSFTRATQEREFAYDVTCETCGQPVIQGCWEELAWAAVLEHRHATGDWVVVTMDDGVVTHAATRRAAYEWVETHEGSPLLVRRRLGTGCYEVRCGLPEEGPGRTSYLVMRADVAERDITSEMAP